MTDSDLPGSARLRIPCSDFPKKSQARGALIFGWRPNFCGQSITIDVSSAHSFRLLRSGCGIFEGDFLFGALSDTIAQQKIFYSTVIAGGIGCRVNEDRERSGSDWLFS